MPKVTIVGNKIFMKRIPSKNAQRKLLDPSWQNSMEIRAFKKQLLKKEKNSITLPTGERDVNGKVFKRFKTYG